MMLVIFSLVIASSLMPGFASARDGGRQIFVVQVDGPTHTEQLDRLLDESGAKLIGYLPDQTYLLWAGESARQKIDELATDEDFILHHGKYRPDQKLAPSLRSPGAAARSSTAWVAMNVVTDKGIADHVIVKVDRERLAALAARPDVISIEPWSPPKMLDERQGMVIAGSRNSARTGPGAQGYLNWLLQRDFPADPSAYPIVDVADDGFDNGSAVAPAHHDFYRSGNPANPSRMAYAVDLTSDDDPHGAGGHGTLNMSVMGGFNNSSVSSQQDSSGYNHGLGISPFGRMGSTKIFDDQGQWDVDPDFEEIVSDIYDRGARISSNSWGTTSPDVGHYDFSARTYDRLVRDASTSPGLQPITMIFAAGNEGYLGPGTISLPGTAKNVITVGAAESFRPENVSTCMGPEDGDNVQDMANFSGRGPTRDGRIKPEVVAPGTRILGAASQGPFYTASSVCQTFYPFGQTLYTWSSGTSHATPAVSGAASLIHNHFTRTTGKPPSPAMVKAILVNGARYMTGAGAGDRLPSRSQGFGIVDLGRSFDATKKVHLDQHFRISATGQSYTWRGLITDPGRQSRITIAWTDPPGIAGTTKALVNDLDLEVVVGGKTYRGNYFSPVTKQYSAVSTLVSQRDSRNNVESITIPAGASGRIDIRIRGRSIAGDGVPGNSDTTDQDFALVAYNARVTVPMSIRPAHTRVVWGGSLNLYGWLQTMNSAAIKGAPVFVQAKQPDGRWATIANPYTTSTGYYSKWVRPGRTQSFRAYYPGNSTNPPGITPESKIEVSARVAMDLSTYTLRSGRAVKVRTWVSPSHRGKVAYLQVWDSAAGRWRWLKTLRLSSTSYGSVWWTPAWRGRWPVRIYFPADWDHAAGASATRTVTVK